MIERKVSERVSTNVLFIGSFIALIISIKLSWNMGIYVDEYGTSPDIVYGGEFWLAMSWLRLAVLSVVTMIAGIKFFHK